MPLMGFTLDLNAPPNWPHIVCTGTGYAWHEDKSRQRCFVGEVSAPAQIVAAAIDGRDLPGIDRILAILALKEHSGTAGLVRVFRAHCPRCEGNHLERATRALRALSSIHPDAYEALRKAWVPENSLCEPRIKKKGKPESGEPDKKPGRRRIPVYQGDAAKTRAAQIAFAVQYQMRER